VHAGGALAYFRTIIAGATGPSRWHTGPDRWPSIGRPPRGDGRGRAMKWVRNPQNVTQLVPYIGPGRGNDRTILVPQTVSQTISVSLNCSP
jgi:hypothetical protein